MPTVAAHVSWEKCTGIEVLLEPSAESDKRTTKTKPLFWQVVKDYADVADFVIIYVAEAHATDGYSIQVNKFQMKEHRNIGKYTCTVLTFAMCECVSL